MSSYQPSDTRQLDQGIESNIMDAVGKGYNEKGNLDQTRNFAEFATAQVLTPVITKQYSGFPEIASSNSSFSYESKVRPVSSSSAPVIKVALTLTGQGITIDLTNSPLSIDKDGAIGFPIKVSNLTPTFTIVLEGTTNADTLTLSAVDLTSYGFEVNEWKNLTLKAEQFTATASFPYSDIRKVKITGTGATDLYLQQIQTANNIFCLVGAELNLVFSCLKELEDEMDRKAEMVMCQNTTKDNKSTGAEATINFKALGLSMMHEGYSMGTSIKGGEKLVTRKVNGDKGLKNLPVTSGQIVTAIATNPKNTVVKIDGATLLRVDSTALVDDTSYHVTDTGTYTLATTYNGRTAEIYDKFLKYTSYIEDKGIVDSFAFDISFRREIEGGKVREMRIPRFKLNSIKGAQEDAYVDAEVEASYFVKNGKYKETMQH